MPQSKKSLDDLRAEIDRIDDAMHDLVMQRAALLSEIGAAKASNAVARSGAFLRPGREAAVLRRLVARHRGPFPKPALVRLWRELVAAPLALQGAFSVAVYAPKTEPGYWDLARDHYGGQTPFMAHGAASQVLGAVSDGTAAVGILPMIKDDDRDPWWRALLSEGGKGLWIIARLPMAGAGNARGEGLEALVVGPVAPEMTGRDRSFLAFETEEELSRARVTARLTKSGLSPNQVTIWRPGGTGSALYLVEMNDLVTENDARVSEVRGQLGGEACRVFFLGGYALPFTSEELAASA